MRQKVEFIESYIKIGNGDYQWSDNHGELIRCGNCKHGTVSDSGLIKCGGVFRTAEFYCADGERKENTIVGRCQKCGICTQPEEQKE